MGDWKVFVVPWPPGGAGVLTPIAARALVGDGASLVPVG